MGREKCAVSLANKNVRLLEKPNRIWVTAVTDVMTLNYTVGLDMFRDRTQYNTQGVWPCKLPIDIFPLQFLAMSPDLMEDLSKQPRRNTGTGIPMTGAGFEGDPR